MIGQRMRVIGIFAHLDSLIRAIQDLKSAGYDDVACVSPVPLHEIDEMLERKKSPVKFFTLAGGLLGGATGLILTTASSLHYPLITGGKPIISIPPFLVIVFELVILFGALSTILGMLINIRLPRLRLEVGYDPRFSEDRFGLWVSCGAAEAQMAEDLLRAAGAQEVRRAGN